ncbi:MAG TPA: hypothetical protein PK916_08855 [Bacteroidota bacterium]|nr:hypothetical protein [Bacteroidota bacterium]
MPDQQTPYISRPFVNWHERLHPTDVRFLGTEFSHQGNEMLTNWKGFENEYRSSPQFDAAGMKGRIDDSYYRSIAQLPSIAGNLKGMGVNAAQGQAALMQSLPLMQSRAEAYGNLERDQYQADQSRMNNLGNIIMQGNQMGMSQQQLQAMLYKMMLEMELNG